jgi:hypothetical protein
VIGERPERHVEVVSVLGLHVLAHDPLALFLHAAIIVRRMSERELLERTGVWRPHSTPATAPRMPGVGSD